MNENSNKSIKKEESFLNGKITIADVAEALGVSKTTVSRAISGKGRIGEETKQRVREYIEQYNYKPNHLAKGLAQQKTYNLGWVVPGDCSFSDLPFFQTCLGGIIDYASSVDYDIVVAMGSNQDISQVERLVNNRKVDGIILSRTLENDRVVAYLKQAGIPFIAIGSSQDSSILQVDSDHSNACRELTCILLLRGIRKLGLIGGASNLVVTKSRQKGFVDALAQFRLSPEEDFIALDIDSPLKTEQAVRKMLEKGAECIVCMDDSICTSVIATLRKLKVSVPKDVKVASFYNSVLLENNTPAITSLQFDPKQLGIVACKTLLEKMSGEEVNNKTTLGYDVLLKESTDITQ